MQHRSLNTNHSLLWPMHAVVVGSILAVAIYTMVTVDEYTDSCSSLGWLLLASLGFGAQMALALSAIVIYCRVRILFVAAGREEVGL